MEFDVTADRNPPCGACGCGRGGACEGPPDPKRLDGTELLARFVEVGRARDRINGLFSAVAGELVRRDGKEATAWMMREYLRVSGLQARRDAALAGELVEHGLGDTVAAMCAGEITAGHARLIATEAPKERHMDEADLLGLSRDYAVDTCGRAARTVAAMQVHPSDATEADEAGDEQYRAQRAERRASLRQTADGTWELSGRFDYLTGRRISQSLHAMIASLRQEPGDAQRSYPQRAADALAQLVTGERKHLRPATSLLVIADYDVVAGQLANPRLDDGTPATRRPARRPARRTRRAKVLPAVFDATWSNLALGTSHNAGDAQKLVLAARDGGCISCRAHSEKTHAHHIEYWSNGGPTNIPNLASLCPRCHDLIHDHNWTIGTPPDGHPKIRPPTHLRLPADTPTVGSLDRAMKQRPPDNLRLPPNPPPHTSPVLRT